MTSTKNALLAMAAAGALAACAGSGMGNGGKESAEPEAIGMANPASVYCVEQGGRLEPRKDAEGNEYAMCHLPDGRVVEEWEFFRSNHKQ